MTTYKKMPPAKVEYLVVHCADTPPDMDIGKAEIDRWHRERGWFGIGYHKVIRRDGRIEDGRPLDQPGAHVINYNGKSIGICMVGGRKAGTKNVAEFNFTELQMASLRHLLIDLKRTFPNAKIVGHRDLQKGKACPTFDVREYLDANPLIADGQIVS
jgi:N-acetylmuramoyl-L-alanine amidase